MKRPVFGVAAAALGMLLGAGVAVAQDKTHTETTTKQTGPGPNVKTKTEWVSGTVTDYTPGKSIKISGPGDKTYSFDLDEAARVEGGVVVGQSAKVGYHKSTDGAEHVVVISTASHSSQAAAMAPRSHVETATKQSGPGPDVKTKSEVVVGTVKEYEPGKKIKVEGPGDKSYTFDLDEGVGMTGNVAVGERVKVTYSKTTDGNKVTTIQPARGH